MKTTLSVTNNLFLANPRSYKQYFIAILNNCVDLGEVISLSEFYLQRVESLTPAKALHVTQLELDSAIEIGMIVLDEDITLESMGFSLDSNTYNDFLDLYYGDIYGNSN